MLYAEKLKEIRTDKRISRKKLASLIKKSEQIIYFWETGKRNPCDSDIRVIAKLLNVHISEISNLKEISLDSRTMAQDVSSSSFLENSPDKIDEMIDEFSEMSKERKIELKAIRENTISVSAENSRLRNRISRYESLINSLSQMVYVKDINLKFKALNSAFLNIIGKRYLKEEVINSKGTDVFGFKEISEILKYEQEVFRTKEKIRNKQIIIPNTTRSGLLSITPRIGQDGRVAEIVTTIKDVTNISEALDMMSELETVTNMINQGVWVAFYNKAKKSYTFTSLNATFSDLYGISKHNLMNNFFCWFDAVHRDDVDRVQKWFNSEVYPKEIEYKVVNQNSLNIKRVNHKIHAKGESLFGIITIL